MGGGVGGSSVAGGNVVGSPVVTGGCGSTTGSATGGGVSLVLLGDGAYVVGGSFVAVDGGSSCTGVLSVGRIVGAGAVGLELAVDRFGVISLALPDQGILEPTAVRFSRTSRNTVPPSVPSSVATCSSTCSSTPPATLPTASSGLAIGLSESGASHESSETTTTAPTTTPAPASTYPRLALPKRFARRF